jgi:BirA family biotin operon repressor/biotin-[acetyl-CoA-carboxylase] ligase
MSFNSSFDIAFCRQALGDAAERFHLTAVGECDSTNTQLMHLAEAGAPSGSVMVADRQTAGRGRRGRTWYSSSGHSLTFSLLWRFPASSSAPEALSLVIGLCLQRVLQVSGIAVSVKWPNDILCNQRKIAGTLIEIQSGDIKSVVIGIGINLRLPSGIPPEVSGVAAALADVMPRVPMREQLLAALLLEIGAALGRYAAEGFAAMKNQWNANDALQGRQVIVDDGVKAVAGLCSGVTERGELLLATPNGTMRFVSGDVSLRPA